MIKALKIFCAAICVISGIILVVFLVPQSGFKAMSVLTGSMNPAIPQESLVIVQRVPYSKLEVGDVVTYINPQNTKQTITHRIVELKTKQGLPALITKGDANEQNDAEILGGNVVGRVTWHYPKIGGFLNHSKGWPIIILLVFIPAAFIIYDEIRILRGSLKKTSITPDDTPKNPPTKDKPKPAERISKQPSRPNIDGIAKRALLIVALSIFTFGCANAALFSQARLVGNTISVNNTSSGGNHGTCPVPNHNGTITNTGPDSTNSISFNDNCNINIVDNNNVGIINNNNQQSTSGSGSNSGNSSANNQTTNINNINNQ